MRPLQVWVMPGYNFSDRVRKVLQMAREETARLHNQYVGTEHILLALIREGEGIAVCVLINLGVDLAAIRQTIEETVRKGEAAAPAGPDLPYTARAKKVLELAMREALHLHFSYVGTEHLLLGMLAEEKGIVARVLGDAGVTLQAARAETLRLLGGPFPTQPKIAAGTQRIALLTRISELVGELLRQPSPDPARAREIGVELTALVGNLTDLL